MVSRYRFIVVLMAMSLWAPDADARPARPAPALPPPAGAVVNVSTEAQLQTAMGALTSNMTIVLAPGTYRLTRSLYFNGALENVGLRGATGNSDDVVLIGPGMTEASYGSVPYGVWTGNGVNGITIANLTLREFYYHPIIFNGGTERPHVYNVHLIDAGQQFIKSNPDASGVGATGGIVEYSIFEFTTTARDDYPKGIDVHGGSDWIIRHNLFRNLQAPAGQLIGPAVLVWNHSRNTTTEGNTFLNCGRGIMYGGDDLSGFAHTGGLIRNNIFYRSSSQPGDVGIQVADSPDTQVLHNTVILSGTYGAAIEYRFPSATGLLIANNLVDAAILAREGAAATLAGNFASAIPALFINAAAGNLHLSATAATAIDGGVVVTNAGDDWDGEARPAGSGYDIGADERGAGTQMYDISGHIRHAQTGAAVSGVTVTLGGARVESVGTDSAGAFRFSALAAGVEYTVTPALAGYTFYPERYDYPQLARDETATDFEGRPAGVGGVNQPPVVALLPPAGFVHVGDRIALTANASDPDGAVSSVAFQVSGRTIAVDSEGPPFTAVWKPGKAGTYVLVAVATDARALSASSEPVTVTVAPRARR